MATTNGDIPTQGDKLKGFYGSETATMYAGMMDEEMVKYTNDFELIFQTLQAAFPTHEEKDDGTTLIRVLDTCCGSGHMLKYIGQHLENRRSILKGIDLSPDMLKIAQSMMPESQKACLRLGNMLDVKEESDQHYHLILNNFAMHHATAQQAESAIQEYARLLVPKGCLFFSAWEGAGCIDYGDMDLHANYHSETDMNRWITKTAGLEILKCRSFVEEDMGMNSVYIIAQKQGKRLNCVNLLETPKNKETIVDGYGTISVSEAENLPMDVNIISCVEQSDTSFFQCLGMDERT